MKIVNNSATVMKTPLYEIIGEDGPLIIGDFYVTVVAEDGNEYKHYKLFKAWAVDDEGIASIDYSAEAEAEKLMNKVNSKGEINLEHWEVVEPFPSYALGEVSEVSLMDEEERMHLGC